MRVRISDIQIGDRYRKTLGDVAQLAASIAEIGLLHPVVITPDNRLIAGQRRIAACQSLGLLEIEATVIDLQDIVKGEFAENEMRKDFTWSERVEIAKALEPPEREAARERMEARDFGRNTTPENFTEVGRSMDKVATAVGTSRPTLSKALEVYEYGDEALIKKMDETGKVDGVHREMKRREREALPQPVPPTGKYRVIYADPPWCYGDKLVDGYGPAENHYPSLSIAELCALPISELADDNAVLFMWVTSPLFEECFAVINAWGFKYKASFVWDKVRHNYGHYNSVRHELLLIGTRGSCLPETHQLYDSVVSVERSDRHSEKPSVFREMIETLYPSAQKIELFARTRASGWDTWGNEV